MIAAGDDNDVAMDGGPVKDGDRNACDQPPSLIVGIGIDRNISTH